MVLTIKFIKILNYIESNEINVKIYSMNVSNYVEMTNLINKIYKNINGIWYWGSIAKDKSIDCYFEYLGRGE